MPDPAASPSPDGTTDHRPALRAVYRAIAAQRAELLRIACADRTHDLTGAIGHLDLANDWIEAAAQPKRADLATAGARHG